MANDVHSNSYKGNVRYMQYVCAACVGILQASQFATVAWISPALPQLLAHDSPIGKPITYDEASWLVSVVYLGLTIGSVLLPFLLDKFGPKGILLVGAGLTIVSWIVLGLTKSVAVLIFSRIIAGIANGVSYPCTSIYMCEIASKDIRGRLGAIPVLIGVLGSVFVLTAGPYLEYTALIISCAILPIIFIVPFWFMPSSPYFLIKKGNRTGAGTSLQRLLGASSPLQVENELRDAEETVKRETSGLTLVQSLCLPNFRKSLFIVFVTHNIFNFSGMTFIGPYLQVIVPSDGSSVSKELASVLYGVVQIPSVLLSGILIDKWGRRPIFCISSLGAGVSLIVLGAYIYLQLDTVSFLPVLCLILYHFFICLGVLHFPYFIAGELFTANTKKVGTGIISFYSSAILFANIKIFGIMFTSWGLHTVFWVCGGVCLFGVLFALFMLPETKGKSFREIQDNLSSSIRKSSSSYLDKNRTANAISAL